MNLVLDGALALLVLLAAARATLARQPLPAVVAFIGYGLALGVAWVRLGAPDVAMTEVAVGGGVTGLVLLRAVSAAAAGAEAAATPVRRVAALALSLVVFAALAGVVVGLPEPAPSLAEAVATHLPPTGLGNPITGVLIVFRALDTLLETVVLLLALIGVWSLSPDRSWAGALAGLDAPPSGALDFLARVIAPVGLVVGIYMFWAGADVPGGAFQGGAVLAAMGLLVIAAGIRPPPRLQCRSLRLMLLAGPFAFLGVGVAGWFVAGAFLDYPAGIEKPVIIAVEVAITLSIAVTLALLVLGPPKERAP